MNEEILEKQFIADQTSRFQAYRDSLEKEPEATDVEKEYIVGCYTEDGWNEIHTLLTSDETSEDNVPSKSVTCVNDKKHSKTRGIYSLTDVEVSELKKHPLVQYININAQKYPGTYSVNPLEIIEATKFDRYAATVKHQRQLTSAGTIPTNPSIDLLNRGSWQLLRHKQNSCPWQAVNDSDRVFDDKHAQYGDGSDVDIIVCDQDMWFGHIEFQNNLGTGPRNYRGGNVLPGDGSCDLLDLILDSPYYLDSAFFDANPSKLETRWDGTIVPTETAAHQWWENNSTSYRSSKFVSITNGGTATGNNDFGTLSINSGYTRANSNGSNTAYNTGTGFHGTPCASQAYGRQYGWAYNANKWFLNLYGTNSHTFEFGFDLQKIFHQIKPVNSTYGTQDPTISSNSWSNRFSPASSGYYWFRPATNDGTTDGNYYTSKPAFMNNYSGGTRAAPYTQNSVITAGDELIDSGVIFVVAAGNRHQKIVNSDHPDFDNYDGASQSTSLLNATSVSGYSNGMGGLYYYRTHNRIGFPGQIGVNTSTSPHTYRTITVGALDDTFSSGKERLASYSQRGEAVDVYACSDYTLAACEDNAGTRYNRYDSYYTIDGVQSVESEDRQFNGTSSACPIFVGLLATKVQYNRSWTVADCKSWINSISPMPSANFLYSTEPDTATGSEWGDNYGAWESSSIVAYDHLTGSEPASLFESDITSTNTFEENQTVNISVTTDAADGTYYFSCEKDDFSSNITSSHFASNSLTGSFTITSGAGTISIALGGSVVNAGQTESFRVRIRTGSVSGDVVATSQDFTITDAPEPNPFVFATGQGLSFSGSISITFE